MQEASDLTLFLGRFHPLVVHLPIGFLLFAFLLEVGAKFQKNKALEAAIPFALLSGAISALVACVLGYLLSLSGDYQKSVLDTHFWVGIATTAVAFMAWAIRTKRIKIPVLKKLRPNIALLTLTVLLVGITGHYGGNLTHGSDYLVKYAPFSKKNKQELPVLTSINDAQVYPYLVAPILENKCLSCHNASKQKGGLAMHTPELFLKGGENGPVIVSGKGAESELLKRVTLPENHEDFMPPEGKTPLTEEEIKIVTFWIENIKGNFEITLDEVDNSPEIMAIASKRLALEPSGTNMSKSGNLSSAPMVSLSVIQNLAQEGFIIRELVAGSNFYDVSLAPNSAGNSERMFQKLKQLLALKANVIRLDVSENLVNDNCLEVVSQFPNLEQLQLEKNPITDAGIQNLADLDKLKSLNLYGTNVGKPSLSTFMQMSSLKTVYAWQTNILAADISGPDLVSEELKIVLGAL